MGKDMPKTKSMCCGCRDNYYNLNRGGCWSFANAKIVKRVRVGIWEPPPYSKDRAEKCLSCYRPEGYAMLEVTDCRVKNLKANRDG
jgi:hypothetical protein